jgi:ASC-1-like (ASCH) protein
MKTWKLKFASYKKTDDILNFIEDGSKTVETRPVDLKNNYSLIKPGDKLVCLSIETGKKVIKTAGIVKVYPSLEKMVQKERPQRILPGVKSKDHLLEIFEQFKENWGEKYKNNLEKNGIVVIYLS